MLLISRILQVLGWFVLAGLLLLGLVTWWLRRNLDTFQSDMAQVERIQAACRTYLQKEFKIDIQPTPRTDAIATGITYTRDSGGHWTLHDDVLTAKGERRYVCSALENRSSIRVVGVQWQN